MHPPPCFHFTNYPPFSFYFCLRNRGQSHLDTRIGKGVWLLCLSVHHVNEAWLLHLSYVLCHFFTTYFHIQYQLYNIQC